MQGPANFIGFRRSYKLGHTWHKLCRWAIGMKVRYCGNISSATPTLFVANHISYLDIPALGSLLDATFIAKSEIKSWPIFGLLCSLQRTVFIERDWRKALTQREQLYERLDQRDNLILFPEGTSNSGTFVRNFKSALFSAADWKKKDCALVVQPVTIAYTKFNGSVMGRRLRPIFAWYGDMDLKPHLMNIFKLFSIKAQITYLPALNGRDFMNRKDMTSTLHHAIDNFYSNELNDSLSN